MAGFIHDVVVDESSRRSGIAGLLVEAAIAWLRAQGAPRVVLWTAELNPPAQRLFAGLGFRRTMIEMTREIPSSNPETGSDYSNPNIRGSGLGSE
jgi:GNAT superfamily N-acetyltransferase